MPEGWYKLTITDSENPDEDFGDLDIQDVDNLTTIDGTGDARFTVIDAIGLDLGSECRFLRRNGNLGARRDCDNRQFINARLGEVRNGKVPWTFRLRA